MADSRPRVLSLSTGKAHTFSKSPASSLTLIANYGVQGDCHAGTTVQHRSRLHIRPAPANLRQAHLMPLEILQRVSDGLSSEEKSRLLSPGALGQNITTKGVDLLGLPVGTELRFVTDGDGGGDDGPVLVLTGLRNPCAQINRFCPGLQERFLVRNAKREITARLAGVMSTVKVGGEVRAGMSIVVVRPEKHVPLGPV
ncbi:MOSC domain-containing protein [Aspergillus foveolatus]|uniref:MOSC domain-containing protein n=1 Tax=Aspergillus foveolatus TaxID=210207 RepID=UPI003CCCF9E7